MGKNYIFKVTRKSGAFTMMLLAVGLSFIMTTINARFLYLLSKTVVSGDLQMVWLLGGLSVVQILLNYAFTYFNTVSFTRVWEGVTKNFHDKVTRSDYEFYVKHSSAELLAIEGTIHKFSKAMRQILYIIENCGKIIVNLIAIAILCPKSLVWVILLYGVGTIFLKISSKKWDEIDSLVDANGKQRSKYLSDTVNGFSEIKTFCQEEVRRKALRDYLSIGRREFSRRALVDCNINTICITIDSILTVVLLLIGIQMVSSGQMTGEVGVSLVMYGWRLIDPVANVVFGIGEYSEMMAGLPKFMEVMNFENRDTSNETVELTNFDGEIRFHHVGFSYEDSNNVLKDLNLVIKKGQHIGICGPSGGGKSTLLKLINKFHVVDKGMITIDGIDYAELKTESLRARIGSVQQDPFIFDDTVEANLRFVKPFATEHEIIEACKKASIYDFILTMKEGFKTHVGSNGLKLSGGQKQRIALARLFLADPDIILLDEATSALDNNSEAVIQESLNLFKDKTMIIVAHRLSTIRDCDQIVLIKDHKVAEKGTHEELKAMKGHYYNMLPKDEKEAE